MGHVRWCARLFCVGVLVAASACHLANERPTADVGGEPDALSYTMRLVDDLQRADVTVCTPGGPAFQLRPGRDEAGARLLAARFGARPLTIHGGKIQVPASTSRRCVDYSVHLRDGGQLASLVSHSEHGLVTSVNAWLYRPEKRSPSVRARLAIALPEGMTTHAPYERAEDGSYVLDAQAFRFDAYVTFGKSARSELVHGGIRVEAVILDEALPESVLSAWIAHHLDALGPLSFALRRGTVNVLALPARAQADVFGCVTRGGRDSVLVFVPRGVSLAALRDDWVLSHELSHFALPFVRREDAWAAEGFATYFQEVLRSRAAQREPRAVAEDFFRTLLRVEADVGPHPLEEESRHMGETGHYRSVYWGGAAVFFALDVALRTSSDGGLGLAELVERFRAGTNDERDFWTADELLSALDHTLGSALLAPLSRAAIARPFPDFRATFATLGIREKDGTFVFDEHRRELREHVFGRALGQE